MSTNKFHYTNSQGFTTEGTAVTQGGTGNASKLLSLNAAGQLDPSVMPPGNGLDTQTFVADGALPRGTFVNLFRHTDGSMRMRKADASNVSTKADAFVLDAVADGAVGTAHFEGTNTSLSGLTVGDVWLSVTAGLSQTTPASSTNEITQYLGVAVSASAIKFEPGQPIIRA